MLICWSFLQLTDLLFLQPLGQIGCRVAALQGGSQPAQDVLLRLGQVAVQLVQLVGQSHRFRVHGSRRHWG